jgi:hypothetical protein
VAEPTLFDVDPVPVAEPAPNLSADARRTQRQRMTIMAGWHPLGLAASRLRLHPEAARVTGPDDQTPGPRCGDCVHRRVIGHHARSYPKCMFGGPPFSRASHGAGTDVRAWWPACVDFQLKEAAA